MSDVENEDHEIDDKKHKNFLVSMAEIGSSDGRFKLLHGNDDVSIAGQSLSEIIGESVTVDKLLSGKKTAKTGVAKSLKKSYEKSVAKNKDLRIHAPASSIEEAKIARSATRKKFTEQLNKWDAAVHSRRAATNLSFPLQKPDMGLKTAKDQTRIFKSRTPLEEEVAKLLYGEKVSDVAPENDGVGLSVREMREKLSELSKIRAHENYQQQKLRRQNKIKSKKYRRQLRKEKKKEMESLREKGAGDKEIERATERATLKHTKSSKNLHFLAKHSDTTLKNQVLAEKDRKKRELKAKEEVSDGEVSEDDVEIDKEDEEPINTETDPNNPWTVNREEKLLDLIKTTAENRKKEEEEKAKNVDPNNFIQVNVKSNNFEDNDLETSDEEEEILNQARTKMAEAFAGDDDILRDFKKEQREKAELKRKKNLKTSLPGWGNWAGSGIEQKEKRKRSRQRQWEKRQEKLAKKPKMSQGAGDSGYRIMMNDSARGHHARSHQSSSIPFPFTSVSDFEASIRMPIGDTFVPRTSFKKLTQPKISVAKGAIVEPMDKSELVKRDIKFTDDKEIDVDCGTF